MVSCPSGYSSSRYRVPRASHRPVDRAPELRKLGRRRQSGRTMQGRDWKSGLGNKLNGSPDGCGTRACSRVQNGESQKEPGGVGRGAQRALGVEGPSWNCRKEPKLPRTLPKAAASRGTARGFSLDPSRDSCLPDGAPFGATTSPRRLNTNFHFATFQPRVLFQKAISEPPAVGNARTSGLLCRSASWESVEAAAGWWREDA